MPDKETPLETIFRMLTEDYEERKRSLAQKFSLRLACVRRLQSGRATKDDLKHLQAASGFSLEKLVQINEENRIRFKGK